MSDHFDPGAFITLLGSAVAMTFGVLLLSISMGRLAYRYFGLAGVGVVLIGIALLLYWIHLWLDEEYHEITAAYAI